MDRFFRALLVLLAACFAAHPVPGRDLEDALVEIPDVWLDSIGPLKPGENVWTDYTAESVYPFDRPEPGIVRARATAERIEILVEDANLAEGSAELTKAVFVSPSLVFTAVSAPLAEARHSPGAVEDGLSLLDLLLVPDLRVGLFDVSNGRIRVRQREGLGEEPFDLELTGIRLQGSNLDTIPEPGGPQMRIVGTGRIPGRYAGKVSLQWFGVPGDGVADMKFSFGLDEIDLAVLEPFLTGEVDFRIEEGNVSLLVNGTCREGRYLETTNHLILEDVKIGTPEEAGIEGMTFATVAGMLGGTMSVEFPVKGDLLDPDFDMAEAYANGALAAAFNQATDRLLSGIPAENRLELKEKLLEWVAPDLPEDQKREILGLREE
jgi:hypothetical protein